MELKDFVGVPYDGEEGASFVFGSDEIPPKTIR